MHRTLASIDATRLAEYLPSRSRLHLIALHVDPQAAAGLPLPRRTPFDRQLLTALLGPQPRSNLYHARDDAKQLVRLPRHQQTGRIARTRSPTRATAILAVLLAQARATVHQSPAEAHDLSAVAVRLAADGAAHSTPGAEALALAYQANARRADGRLADALPIFRCAARALACRPAPPWVEAEIASLEASWLKDSRRFAACELHLHRAIDRFQAAGDTPAQSRALMILADCHRLAARPAAAVSTVRRALERIHPLADARLFLYAHHNLCRYLCALGDAASADALFRLLAPVYETTNDRQTNLRRHWLDGVIAHRLHQAGRAESALRVALAEYLSAPIPFYAALVSLDLALVLFEQGRTGEVAELAAALPPLFEAEGIHAEATAAALIFHRAAAQERLNAALLARLRDFFRRAQVDQEARFTLDPPNRSPSTDFAGPGAAAASSSA